MVTPIFLSLLFPPFWIEMSLTVILYLPHHCILGANNLFLEFHRFAHGELCLGNGLYPSHTHIWFRWLSWRNVGLLRWWDAVLSWGIWECWDGVNVIYIWYGHTLQGAREQTLLCSVMTPNKTVYLLIFKTCEYVT